MVLDFETIKSVAQGAERITESKNGYKFSRFSEAEQEIYDTIKPEMNAKTVCSSGIRLEFETDADSLYLAVNVEATYDRRHYFAFDIMVDGEYVDSLKNFDKYMPTGYINAEYLLGDFEKTFTLKKGAKRVGVYFPFYNVVTLKEFRLDNATFVNPVKKDITLITYGDSITQGYDGMHPSHSYAVRLADKLGATLYNKAIGGEIFFPQLSGVKSELEPDIVTVAYGTNDWSKLDTLEEILANCRNFYKNLKNNYKTAKIYAITPIWRKAEELEEDQKDFTLDQVRDGIANICTELGITAIDGRAFVPHDPKYFADLTLHPNDEGYEHYVNNLYKNIVEK